MADVTRREFLKRAALAAAAPAFVPASALGKDGHTAPSERIGMGFIGLGGQGRGHLLGGAWTYVTGGLVAREDVQVLATCDVWRGRREEPRDKVEQFYAARLGQGKYRGCEAYQDFREVLARPDIDAVLIASPIHWHAMMSLMAVEAGKDVYCEKPTALTVAESRALADAVRRRGRIYQAGTQQRSEYGGKFRTACEVVRNGRLGDLKEVWAYREGGGFFWSTGNGNGQPPPADLDWELWLGPAPYVPWDGDWNAHRFGFGGINWGQHHYDILHAIYTYADGVVVHGGPHPAEGRAWQGGGLFVGTEGRLVVDRDNLVADPPSILAPLTEPNVKRVYHSDSHAGNFLDCVRTRQPTICNADSTHRAASVMILGGIAQTLKRTLRWDPVAERFQNDQEADRLLSVATRPPWRV
ncbi:MAG: Gfo/Idh/MocA family oxidoreductase [Armatimonadetes bacterium]|nr:Gfo/Idh/MocA family oxidoreductase [Armatimonadota bacterium]